MWPLEIKIMLLPNRKYIDVDERHDNSFQFLYGKLKPELILTPLKKGNKTFGEPCFDEHIVLS